MLIHGIEFDPGEIQLLVDLSQRPNHCSDVLNDKHPLIDSTSRKGIIRRCNVMVIFGPKEPGIAITEFGEQVLKAIPSGTVV